MIVLCYMWRCVCECECECECDTHRKIRTHFLNSSSVTLTGKNFVFHCFFYRLVHKHEMILTIRVLYRRWYLHTWFCSYIYFYDTYLFASLHWTYFPLNCYAKRLSFNFKRVKMNSTNKTWSEIRGTRM